MQETILALGALMIIMLIAVNQQRSTIQFHEQIYVREISQARDDFATSLMDGIVNEKRFDEETILLTEVPTDVTILSAAMGTEDASENAVSTFDDLDDFHAFRDTFWHVISADTFRFDVSFTVSYLDEATNTVTSAKTFTKIITAQIEPLQNFGGLYKDALTGRFSKTVGIFEDFD